MGLIAPQQRFCSPISAVYMGMVANGLLPEAVPADFAMRMGMPPLTGTRYFTPRTPAMRMRMTAYEDFAARHRADFRPRRRWFDRLAKGRIHKA